MPFSLLYTCTMAFSDCAAKTCDGLTARQLAAVELFLKVERRFSVGWNSWTQTPTSRRVADAGALLDASVDAMKHSESIRNCHPRRFKFAGGRENATSR